MDARDAEYNYLLFLILWMCDLGLLEVIRNVYAKGKKTNCPDGKPEKKIYNFFEIINNIVDFEMQHDSRNVDFADECNDFIYMDKKSEELNTKSIKNLNTNDTPEKGNKKVKSKTLFSESWNRKVNFEKYSFRFPTQNAKKENFASVENVDEVVRLSQTVTPVDDQTDTASPATDEDSIYATLEYKGKETLYAEEPTSSQRQERFYQEKKLEGTDSKEVMTLSGKLGFHLSCSMTGIHTLLRDILNWPINKIGNATTLYDILPLHSIENNVHDPSNSSDRSIGTFDVETDGHDLPERDITTAEQTLPKESRVQIREGNTIHPNETRNQYQEERVSNLPSHSRDVHIESSAFHSGRTCMLTVFLDKASSFDEDGAYHYEWLRLKTFSNWPLNSVFSTTLARNGWVALGQGDMARCYSCHVVHGGWKVGDNPEQYHGHNCRFLQGQHLNVPISRYSERQSPNQEVTSLIFQPENLGFPESVQQTSQEKSDNHSYSQPLTTNLEHLRNTDCKNFAGNGTKSSFPGENRRNKAFSQESNKGNPVQKLKTIHPTREMIDSSPRRRPDTTMQTSNFDHLTPEGASSLPHRLSTIKIVNQQERKKSIERSNKRGKRESENTYLTSEEIVDSISILVLPDTDDQQDTDNNEIPQSDR